MRFQPAESKLYESMNRFIVRTIEKKTKININDHGDVISPNLYGDFVKEILIEAHNPERPLSACVITFNYDIALDYMMEYFSGENSIAYFLEDEQHSCTYKFIKLHGSINWGLCSDNQCKRIQPVSIKEHLGLRPGPRKMEMSKILGNINCECGNKLKDFPLIVPPTWNKTGNYNIERVWKQASKELSEAKNIFIIGYSLPKTDLFFQYLIALGTLDIENIDRFWVFDINPDMKNKYLKFLAHDLKRKFRFMNGPSSTIGKDAGSFNGSIDIFKTILKSIR